MSGFLNAIEGNEFGSGFGSGLGLLDSFAAELTRHPFDPNDLHGRVHSEPLATVDPSVFSADLSPLSEFDDEMTGLTLSGKPFPSQTLAPNPTSPISTSSVSAPPVSDRLSGTFTKTVDENIENVAFGMTNFSPSESHNSLSHLDAVANKTIPTSEGQQVDSDNHSPVTSLENRQRIQGEQYDIFYARSRNRRRKNKGSSFNVQEIDGVKHVVMRKGQKASYKIDFPKGDYFPRIRSSSKKGAKLTVSIGSSEYKLWIPKTGEDTFKQKSFRSKLFSLSGNPQKIKIEVRSGSVNLDYIDFMEKSSNNSNNENGKSSTETNQSYSQVSGYGLVNAAEAMRLTIGTPIGAENYAGGKLDPNIKLIEGEALWAAGYTGKGVVVGVVDTGIDLNHPDLRGNIWTNVGEIAGDGIDNDDNGYIDDVNGYNFAEDNSNPDDDNGHGTFSAGLMAARSNNFGVTGLAPDATVLPLKALDGNGNGTTSDVAEAITYAVDRGVDILSLSLGVPSRSKVIKEALDYAYSNGVLVVAAAGNTGSQLTYPAADINDSGEGIVVGAVDPETMEMPEWSSIAGPESNYVLAGGVFAKSLKFGGGVTRKSGTSVSTAYIAGLAAALKGAKPRLTSKQLQNKIINSAKPI